MAGLADIARATFEQAVRIYLEEAYGPEGPPERARRRLRWPPGETMAEVAAGEPFERSPPDAPPEACARIRLRLGNRRYPHMKVGLDRVPGADRWVLVVDCHDAMLLGAAAEAERDLVRDLIRANNDLKARVERRWTEMGLPTFERFVRERLAGRWPAGGE